MWVRALAGALTVGLSLLLAPAAGAAVLLEDGFETGLFSA
jgi:hypothetical protein